MKWGKFWEWCSEQNDTEMLNMNLPFFKKGQNVDCTQCIYSAQKLDTTKYEFMYKNDTKMLIICLQLNHELQIPGVFLVLFYCAIFNNKKAFIESNYYI